MAEYRTALTVFRGFFALAVLALLAACVPRTHVNLAPPANLSATPGTAMVTLTWTASNGATGYNVKRATVNGGPYTQLAATTAPGYTDTAVQYGTTYYYVVSSTNAGGEGVNTTPVSATVPLPAKAAVPTNVVATAGGALVTLGWTASDGATSYNVKRSTTDGGPYTQIASPTSNSYVDTPLTVGTTYYYVVSAVNAGGESANSAQVSAIPSNPPPTIFGTWVNVTPVTVDLTDNLCGNFGTSTVQRDPANPSDLYTAFDCQGVWKSTDYGATWTGPINTGVGPTLSDNDGSITISPTSTARVPTIYRSIVRGSGEGFWKSVDGGVNWVKYPIGPTPARQDYSAPVVDPYDQNHLLMAGHEQDSVVESIDGGQTWSSVSLNSGMLQNGTSGVIFFIDTGNAATTRATWLWQGSSSGGKYGTWRTANSGSLWVQVDKNEHPGGSQIYQPDSKGVVLKAGNASILGDGVLRSTDYGQTWSHVGNVTQEAVVIGTPTILYAMYGFPSGPGGTSNVSFEVGSQPGTGEWVFPGTPPALAQGASQLSVVNDGTHNILVGAMWNSGLWRYVEP